MTANINSLARRFSRLQDQAARQLLATMPIVLKCYWGNEEIEHRPGATVIVTDWSTGSQLEREDRDQVKD